MNQLEYFVIFQSWRRLWSFIYTSTRCLFINSDDTHMIPRERLLLLWQFNKLKFFLYISHAYYSFKTLRSIFSDIACANDDKLYNILQELYLIGKCYKYLFNFSRIIKNKIFYSKHRHIVLGKTNFKKLLIDIRFLTIIWMYTARDCKESIIISHPHPSYYQTSILSVSRTSIVLLFTSSPPLLQYRTILLIIRRAQHVRSPWMLLLRQYLFNDISIISRQKIDCCCTIIFNRKMWFAFE